ncbi:unnamed protein product [Fusarium venenatum]|uniref:2EXR domain-containing protein n=1 Tax=Fusarium venenatum TaxID=56646 RepID=A0A2L2SVL6_9HYPO|nr:uncharacterized protein FVRRES_04855 [Fusarium venenatum]KAH6991991.1 hypothetical protein EDB82DRAFT_553892 [Fusarium venenatum]CEI60419.1 unnamed protein product [Fusarium venenatum]
MACQAFTFFGKLPPQIRIKIYIFAKPPRTVSLGLVKVSYDEWLAQCWESKPQGRFTWVRWDHLGDYLIRSITQIPALLYTCKESREELGNYGYKVTFAYTRSPGKRGPRMWFNYHRDALYLPLHHWTCDEPSYNPCKRDHESEKVIY